MEVRDSRPGVTAADEAEDEDDADPSEEGRVGVFGVGAGLSLIHISEPTISTFLGYVF